MTGFFAAFASRRRPSDSQIVKTSVGAGGDQLRALLAETAPADLSLDQVRTAVDGNLWMLTPEAFRYFLPAFLALALEYYDQLGNFAAELVAALTEPSRDDVVAAIDRAAQIPAGMGLTSETLQQLRQQQLEWYDSGTPLATYQERFDGLSAAESEAILAFLIAIRDLHGKDFPFHEPQIAIDRHQARGLSNDQEP